MANSLLIHIFCVHGMSSVTKLTVMILIVNNDKAKVRMIKGKFVDRERAIVQQRRMQDVT